MKRDPNYNVKRYDGLPLLAVLDQFVLSVIMDPTPDSIRALNAMVEIAWGEKGDWREMVMKHLGFDPKILESLEDMWSKNQEIAILNGQELSPFEFARMVSDENFLPMFDGK